MKIKRKINLNHPKIDIDKMDDYFWNPSELPSEVINKWVEESEFKNYIRWIYPCNIIHFYGTPCRVYDEASTSDLLGAEVRKYGFDLEKEGEMDYDDFEKYKEMYKLTTITLLQYQRDKKLK